ncbi:MAG: glycosyltransferase [Candidatus Competibacteraceae bacterium]|nr:MAG: glycosyltransferase [Candidatus Competibacteraceae bacterium]
MRVLHIGKYYPPFAGGIEHFLADLLPALGAHDVAAAALVHDEQPRRWGGQWPSILAPTPSERWKERPIYRAPCFGRLLYAPVSPAFPIWLHRTIRDFRPDLLHLHLPNTSAFWALAVPAARRRPWIVHWHADVVASAIDRRLALAYRLYRPFEQRLLAASQAVVATSPPYLEASTALAPWRERCHIVPLGLDPTRIADPDPAARARAELLWGTTAFRVLAIGRLTYYKGHDVLIRAAASLENSRVLIVGTGEHRERLTALIQALGLGERVGLPGFQPESDLNALLASCDVLCLPSLERTEAFGLVLLEAMRFGKPVVVSDIPGSGAGWVVQQANHGLRAPPGDATALATALRALQHDPDRRRTLGQAGTAALRERFGIEPVAAAVVALYRRVLAAAQPPALSSD